MLGALAASGALMDMETIRQGMNRFFEEKGKNNPKNEDCFRRGAEEAKKR
jgi:2-oxoglutarate ferredoxin oxidoreductase subunit gamma